MTGPLAVGTDLALLDRGVFLVAGGLTSGLSVGRDAVIAGGSLLGVARDAAGTEGSRSTPVCGTP